MANKKKDLADDEVLTDADDISRELIKGINADLGSRVAYNLSEDESPVHIKHWISTGSIILDYIIGNRRNSGLPSGRIIEIFGAPSLGKSLIAYSVARNVQKMGGLVVYIDTESALSVDRLEQMGINTSKKFVFIDEHCTESVFSVIESVIKKSQNFVKKNVPIFVVIDSLSATSPKAELEGDYSDTTIGLQARQISKGLRKINGVLSDNNITLCIISQTRTKIGGYVPEQIATGGAAPSFYASVRLQITGGSKEKSADGNATGINVVIETKKSKVSPPHRRAELTINHDATFDENEGLFEKLKEESDKSPLDLGENFCTVGGGGAWKELKVWRKSDNSIVCERKFHKSDIKSLLKDPECGKFLEDAIEKSFVIVLKKYEEG